MRIYHHESFRGEQYTIAMIGWNRCYRLIISRLDRMSSRQITEAIFKVEKESDTQVWVGNQVDREGWQPVCIGLALRGTREDVCRAAMIEYQNAYERRLLADPNRK